MTKFEPAPIPDGRIDIDGKPYMRDARGALMPVELIKPQHLLEDETVRKVAGFWIALSEQVARFKGHAFVDLAEFDAILEQEYGLKKGGKKGNRTYLTHDGLIKIEVRRPAGFRTRTAGRETVVRRMPDRMGVGYPARAAHARHPRLQHGQGGDHQSVLSVRAAADRERG